MVFARKKRLVGLEIDSGEIRAVELWGKPDDPKLKAWGRETLPEGAVQDGIVHHPEQVSGALSQLWDTNNFKGKDIILGVSNKDVLVRFALFPKVPPEKLGSLIRHQAQDYLPLPLDSVVLDYTVIGETEGDSGAMHEVILVAAKRDMLDTFLSTFSAARLNVWDIDVSSLVLLKILPDEQREGAILLVDVANGQCNILIVSGNMPRLARRAPVRLKDAAAQLDMSVQKMFSQSSLPEASIDNYLGWIDTLISEIRSSISYYQAQPKALDVEEILLSGKGARAPRLAERITETLNTPVKILNPFTEIGIFEQPGNGQEIDYSIAVSLALRGLEE